VVIYYINKAYQLYRRTSTLIYNCEKGEEKEGGKVKKFPSRRYQGKFHYCQYLSRGALLRHIQQEISRITPIAQYPKRLHGVPVVISFITVYIVASVCTSTKKDFFEAQFIFDTLNSFVGITPIF
jgi:hypothetical protein